jgi:LPXTG-site transpeptidase (sortase) family protein
LNSNKLSWLLISAGTLMMVGAITLFALIASGVLDDGRSGNSDLETIPGFGSLSTSLTPQASTPTSKFPPGSDAKIERLVIVDAKIDAPVVTKGVDEAGVMQAPDNATDTAWYDFSARPGFGGNAVFSGHVDYTKVGPAVFWNLKDLQEGDRIEVRLVDGTTYEYAVNFVRQYEAETAPVDEIVGPTPDETVTLITCSGTFNSASHQYDKRLVVRATRIA